MWAQKSKKKEGFKDYILNPSWKITVVDVRKGRYRIGDTVAPVPEGSYHPSMIQSDHERERFSSRCRKSNQHRTVLAWCERRSSSIERSLVQKWHCI